MDKKDNQPKNNGNKPHLRFNFYWIYGIVFVALMGLYLMNDFSMSKELGWTDFQRFTADDAFSRIVVHNRKNILEATVKSDFRDRIFTPREVQQLTTEPKVYVRIPSSDKFSDFYDKMVAEKHISTQERVRLRACGPTAAASPVDDAGGQAASSPRGQQCVSVGHEGLWEGDAGTPTHIPPSPPQPNRPQPPREENLVKTAQ